jgi:hypothetical protein
MEDPEETKNVERLRPNKRKTRWRTK